MAKIKQQRALFSLSSQATYLNCAYMSPLLKSVEKAGIAGMLKKRNPMQVSPKDFFTETEKLRKEYAKLIQAEPSRIVLIPSVSYGLANVMNNLKVSSHNNIVVASEQFPSNYYPWQRLQADTGVQIKIVSPPETQTDRGKQWNEHLLSAIDSNTKLVALGHVHWADGTKFNLKAIRTRTHEVGARMVIDGTQSVGALPFSVKEIQPDALICAGYKWLMGPYSIGMAYYGEKFDNGKPVEENWINRLNSENFSELVNYQPDYQPGALRYEVGEHSNFILVPMMLQALKQINQWKPKAIQEYCKTITQKPIALLREAGFWIEDEAYRGYHLFGIRLPEGMDMETVKKQVVKNKISVSFRGNAIRVSPHVYNTEKDIMKLVKALMGK
ncbi:MAG TPA: aminotransferase class V-fold PLP-dependent enzyme [Cyclobacteriaceae bacterium]|jgi:selenocysteine lyase/cysteine desulfurase|nr:aminotransferase class V-fold PLP-dependent enzyme [Cyclobacteriaceae bacterium]HRF35220.1 aminotransferase class V-fold PLP-dependent enzyme [Cyclobacteriaceae bacterium]